MTRYPHTPGHRGIDTSVAAAESIANQLGYLQRRGANTINAAAAGLTTDELAALLGAPRWTIQPRTSELRRLVIIRDSGVRRRNVTLRAAIVWVAAEGAPQ